MGRHGAVTRALDGRARVELELLAEQASALGRAGARLEDAIDTWRLLVDVGVATAQQIAAAVDDLTAAAYALLVQRECAGFRFANREWVRRHYAIPDEVLRRL